MANMAHQIPNTPADVPPDRPANVLCIYRVPQITIHAFCSTPDVTGALQTAFADRRMARAHCSVHPGGSAEAIAKYQQEVTPNLVIVESRADGGALYAEIDALANVCDPSTKVLVIGYANDVALYRKLMALGVGEYVVAPVDTMSLIAAVARLYQEAGAKKLGRTIAFVGAKGGVGSSAIAHNVGATLARLYDCDAIVADMDLPFGSAGLDFNIEPVKGIEEVLEDESRIDDVLLERLLVKRGDHLSILPAPAQLKHSHDLPEKVFERLIEVVQSNVPFVVLDLPHVWTSWTRNILLAADEVVITAAPDLTSLRNAKNLVDLLNVARRNDDPPRLVLNQVGMPKRAEIKPEKFADVLHIKPVACIPFEPATFSAAANEGKMIAEVSSKVAACGCFKKIAESVSGRTPLKNSGKAGFSFARLWRS
jgi:pilus assembly protein CpaE